MADLITGGPPAGAPTPPVAVDRPTMSEGDDDGTLLKQKILLANIRAAKKARETFMQVGDEVNKYAYGQEDEIDPQTQGVVPFKAKIAKTAQAVEIFVPELYQANPQRRVIPKPWLSQDQAAKDRAALMEDYLNYTPEETNLCEEMRLSVQEAVVYGRGIAWTGWDPKKRLVTTVFDSVKNYLVDADAKKCGEAYWKARKRIKPRWYLLEMLPDAAEKLRRIETSGARPSDSGRASDYSTDMICYWECWYTIGLSRYRDGGGLMESVDDNTLSADDGAKKYIITDDGILLGEEPWEVRYDLDRLWPCEELDMRDVPGEVWPASVLATGLPHQKALNWMYRLFLAKARVSVRTLLAVLRENGIGLEEEEVTKALYGDNLIEALALNVNGAEGKKIGDFLQVLEIPLGVDDFEKFVAIVGKEFEQATGLYEILYYGDTARQIRSAAEVEMKDRNSRSRLVDMRDRVQRFATKIARKEAMAARFLHSDEDMTKLFGPSAGQAWGFLMPSQDDETHTQEQALLAQGAPPKIAARIAKLQAEQITQARQAQGGLVYEDILMETQFSIESGSMRRKDFDQRVDAANEAMNQLVPTLLQSGAQLPAVAIMVEWAQANGMGDDVIASLKAFRDQLMAPPPPMMGPPGAPAPGPGGQMPPGGPPPGMPPGPPMGAPPMQPMPMGAPA